MMSDACSLQVQNGHNLILTERAGRGGVVHRRRWLRVLHMLQACRVQGCEQRRQQARHLAKVLQNLSVNRSNATSHHTGCTWRERVTPRYARQIR